MSARRPRLGAVALAAALAACGSKGHPASPAVTDVDAAVAGQPDGLGAGSGEDVDGPPLEERIAAIEHAMNELAPIANQCWAAAAADELAVAGRVRMLVSVGRDGKATAEAALDEPGKPILIRCLTDVLAAYAWAPPLRGQVVELPFAFTAPAMQNVIDRRMVPRRAQAGVEVAVLLDQLNSANAAISLLEVTIKPGARSGPRVVERTELWMFEGWAEVSWNGGTPQQINATDALLVPAGTVLQVAPADHVPCKAIIAIVPGRREGSARAGALPAATSGSGGRRPTPVVIDATRARRYERPGGAAEILVEPGVPSRAVGRELAYLIQHIEAGAAVPAHVHAGETEVLYVLTGGGTMTVAGVPVPVTEHSVIQVPAGIEHAFTASARTTAIQLYTPAGPEQRFKKPPP